MKICIADIISATNGKLICGDLNAAIKNISTDTRKIESGSFFVALKGEKFDGNLFLIKAKELGACGCLVSKKITDEEFEQLDSVEFAIIKVDDTLKALAQIAASYRRLFEGRVCAVTGSVGKTSTKDMIASVLSKNFTVHKTLGNFNNEIGMPMTILGLREEHTALVVEMGMRNFGEIDYLSSAAKPDVGVITNIGVSHIEHLGSRENIFKAKMELAAHIKQGGTLVLNADDDMLKSINEYENISIMKYSIENKNADIYGSDIKSSENGEYTEFELHIKNIPCEIYNVKLGVLGKHNVYNALGAICVGMIFKMNISDIIDGLSEYVPSEMRQSISISERGVKIINDAYNASPDSMIASLLMFDSMQCKGRKIAVLGDMFELGENSLQYHLNVGEYFSRTNIDILVTIGEMAGKIAERAGNKKINSFNTADEAISYLKEILEETDTVLVKASRGMKLEKVVSEL